MRAGQPKPDGPDYAAGDEAGGPVPSLLELRYDGW